MGLADVHRALEEADGYIGAEQYEKYAAEMEKAAEEDAAGRIMARGFLDEITKIAERTLPITGGAGVERAVAQAAQTANRPAQPRPQRQPTMFRPGTRAGLGPAVFGPRTSRVPGMPSGKKPVAAAPAKPAAVPRPLSGPAKQTLSAFGRRRQRMFPEEQRGGPRQSGALLPTPATMSL